MQINNEQRFNYAPTVKAPRSTFLMHQNIRLTMNAGELVPFYVDSDVMPGDTFKIHGTIVCRKTTSIHPTMDNEFLEVFGVFIPHRITWDHWKEFWGQNTTGAWAQQTTYTIPQIRLSTDGTGTTAVTDAIVSHGLANYMGLPIIAKSATGISVSALPFRAYILTWNELFRDENVCAPFFLYKGDNDQFYGQNAAATAPTWGTYANNTTRIPSSCAPVFKYKDYFNACLPEPQKGSAITLPIGQFAPVITSSTETDVTNWTSLKWAFTSDGSHGANNANLAYKGTDGNTILSDLGGSTIVANSEQAPTNLIADLSNAVAATINAQRFAFATQRILEASARTGTRYWEILEGIFGVANPSAARLQRPEVIFHRKIPVNMTQVPQTSSTDNTSPQGNVTAFSLTTDINHYATKSFTEHGTLMFLACVRQEHSYDGGIDRMWSRKEKLDFYHPQLAFLGEQAILTKEIYADGTSNDNTVFGYNERWAELRYKANKNLGDFSTRSTKTLASWHYGDAYANAPVLSDQWRRETPDFIDRTLVVSHNNGPQYILDTRWDFKATRCIPMYSIPGLLDHF